MQRPWTVAASAIASISMAAPAQACTMLDPLDLEYVRQADSVVVGRIRNYRLLLDQWARRDRERALARLRPEQRRSLERRYSGEPRSLSDHARFDVVVEEVLVGRPGRTLAVTWNNSSFAEPQTLPSGPLLIALRNPPAGGAPLTVLQAPCSSAFIFDAGSVEATRIRAILNRRPARTIPSWWEQLFVRVLPSARRQ